MSDTADFRKIYESHSMMVFNLALGYVHNTEDAEEITQDVFIKVHKKIHNFQNQSSVETWIYRITINTSLDFLKAKKAKKRFAIITSLFHPESQEIAWESAEFTHPGVQMEHKEATERIMMHIQQLPPRQQTALLLMKLEGRTQKETAEIMQIREKAVESLVQRAKKTLSEKLSLKPKGNQK